MLAVTASRLVGDEDVCLVGLGLPQIAAVLAKSTHAPRASLLLELGVFSPRGAGAAMGVADPRMWEGATAFGGMVDVLGFMLQGGRTTLGLIGGLQVDVGGNVNSTLVRDGDGRQRRFLGSGGANDIITHAASTIVVMRHQTRKFKQTVDFVTGTGRLVAGRTRSEAGVRGGGPEWLVTDRAVFAFEDRGIRLVSVHPHEDARRLVEQLPVPVAVPEGAPSWTDEPSVEELRLIRERLDPQRWYTT